mmetsp:Transcript_12055/g.23688  ORF Transcript_12055/g.23688 Transcript_12055/m.23688 type:complete len:227 (-) Transcript_12055:461-1141(-)
MDLLEQTDECLGWQNRGILVDQGFAFGIAIGLLLLVHLFQLEVLVNPLDGGLSFLILDAVSVVRLQRSSLFLGHHLESHHQQPGAFVVEDVGPDFAYDLWLAVAVEEVILDLELDSHGNTYLLSATQHLLGGQATGNQCRRGREIERIEGRLVLDDPRVVFHGEGIKNALLALRLLGHRVQHLSHLGFQADIVKQLHKRDVLLSIEVLLDQIEQERLQDQSIVDGV